MKRDSAGATGPTAPPANARSPAANSPSATTAPVTAFVRPAPDANSVPRTAGRAAVRDGAAPSVGGTSSRPVTTRPATGQAPKGDPAQAGPAAATSPSTSAEPKTGRPTGRPTGSSSGVPRKRGLLPTLPRPLRALLQVTFGLAFLAMLTMAVLFVLVQRGPISVGFLVGPIEEAIREELGAGRVEIESAILRQSEEGRGIEFRLANLRIKDPQGAVLAETPLAGINLSGAALLRGRLAPASVEFIRPTLRLSTTADGGLALAVSRSAPPDTSSQSSSPDTTPVAGGVPASAQRSSTAAGIAPAAPAGTAKPIDIFTALQSTMAEFREGEAVYLRELGVRDATLTIDHHGQETVWRVPGFTVDVQHFQKRSVVFGEGLIGSAAGPWGLSFRTTESRKFKTVRLEVEFAELVPRAIAANLAFLPGLAALDMPVGGTASIEISRERGLVSAEAKVTMSPGRLQLPLALGGVVPLKGGALGVSYSPTDGRIQLHPSELIWGTSRGTWSGHLVPARTPDDAWPFQLSSQQTNLEGAMLDNVTVTGSVIPGSGHTRVDALSLKSGDIAIALTGGSVATPSGAALQLEGTIAPLSLTALLDRWPKSIAPALGEWIKTSVRKGKLAGGLVKLGPSRAAMARTSAATTSPVGETPLLAGLSLDLELQDLHMVAVRGGLPLLADHMRLRLDDGRLEVTTAQARLPLPSGRHVALKDPRLTIEQVDVPGSVAELTMQSNAPASVLLELLDQEPFALLRGTGIDPNAIDARTETNVKVVIPVHPDTTVADIKSEGRIRVSELRSKTLLGSGLDISGGNILLGLTDKALDAKGDILVAGVPAKVSWQRIFNALPDQQPPARLTATLDAADRDTLGVAINHMVLGDVPVVITLQQDAQGQSTTHLEANLSAAELLLDTMAWRKPPGRPAVLHTDIVRHKDGRTELQNFKIIGDDIALDGALMLDARHQLRSFNIPAFAVNVFTKLEMQGRTRDDGVLEVKSKGTAYDGRTFFRSLFSAGQLTERALPAPKNRQGLDLSVEIDTLVGFNDTNLKNVQFTLKRRGEKLVALQASGNLSDSGVPVAAEIRVLNGSRLLQSTTADAGSAFRLIGFYPNMRGGNAILDVNLDGRGAAEKTGRLRASQFTILGDPIVSEAIQAAEEKRRGTRKVAREQVEFERLDVPFSVGHGQVVLSDSTINGPLLGARLNGKIDYNQQTVFLEGSYVPLYGLNSIPNNIPIIGEILSGGRSGDGLFGLNFQIQGAMGRPQVIINPLSVLTPGLFRQIWETAPQGHAVEPRAEPRSTIPPQSSSAAPQNSENQIRTGTTGKASSSGPQRVEPPASTATTELPVRPERAARPTPRPAPPVQQRGQDGQ